MFEKAILDNGTVIQSMIAMEEIAEIQSAFCGFITKPNSENDYKENLSEEIADVLICIKQLQLMYELSDDIYVAIDKYREVNTASATMILSELQKAISKTVRGKDANLEEKVTDAIQVLNYYSFATKPEKLEAWLDKKVTRLKKMHMDKNEP